MEKPAKPYPEFPLFAHASGQWAKKIKGKTVYFGAWDDPNAALAKFKEGKPAPVATPRRGPLTVYDINNLFLGAKNKQKESQDLSEASFQSYLNTCKRMSEFWYDRPACTLHPQDFSAFKEYRAKALNVVSLGNEIVRVKTIFKWAAGLGYIQPLDFGPDFKKPSSKSVRRHRRLQGQKMYSPSQVRELLHEAGATMKAMILLGINCGYQNSDCETLPLDIARAGIKTGWLEYPREKTEIERRAKLWDQTVDAMQAVLDHRPETQSKRFFVWADGREVSANNKDIVKRFKAVRESALIFDGGFSWFRKTFETVAGSDQVAIDYVMGHVDPSMAAVYRQEIADDRLEKVSDNVLRWLHS